MSPAEKRVFDYVMKGMKNREIAEAICISEKTIKFHLTNIYRKLNVRNRAEAILKVSGVYYVEPSEISQ